MREHPLVGFFAGALLSLMAHGVAYGSLAFVPTRPMEPAPSRVSFRVHEPPAPAAAPEPVKPPEPPPP